MQFKSKCNIKKKAEWKHVKYDVYMDTINLWDVRKIQTSDVYENTITSVRVSLTDNHHLRAIVMIQWYSAHATRPS